MMKSSNRPRGACARLHPAAAGDAFQSRTCQHPYGVGGVDAESGPLSILRAGEERNLRLPGAVFAAAKEHTVCALGEAIPGEPGTAIAIEREEGTEVGVRWRDHFVVPVPAVEFGCAENEVMLFARFIGYERPVIRLDDHGGAELRALGFAGSRGAGQFLAIEVCRVDTPGLGAVVELGPGEPEPAFLIGCGGRVVDRAGMRDGQLRRPVHVFEATQGDELTGGVALLVPIGFDADGPEAAAAVGDERSAFLARGSVPDVAIALREGGDRHAFSRGIAGGAFFLLAQEYGQGDDQEYGNRGEDSFHKLGSVPAYILPNGKN